MYECFHLTISVGVHTHNVIVGGRAAELGHHNMADVRGQVAAWQMQAGEQMVRQSHVHICIMTCLTRGESIEYTCSGPKQPIAYL
jgi:hypothetical protein